MADRSWTLDGRSSRYSKMVCILLSLLVVIIPVANAQTLSIQQASGRDNVRGFNRENDVVTITALAQIPGDNLINQNQVRINAAGIDYLFSNCSLQAGEFFVCSWKRQVFGSRGQADYDVRLYNDAGQQVRTVSETMTADILPPQVAVNLDPPVTSTGTSTLNFVVEDYASQQGNTGTCSGVDRVQVWRANSLVSTIPLGQGCVETGSVQVSLTAPGSQNYCVVAIDRLNQSSTQCINLVYDRTAPSISASSVKVVDAQGNDISYITPPVAARVSVQILGNDTSEVVADFSKMSMDATEVVPSEVLGTGAKTYYWDININALTQCQFTVRAKDSAGNTASQVVNCAVAVDNTPPQVTSIRSSAVSGTTQIIGRNATIYVQFRETQSGMSNGDAYMDLSRVGAGSRVKADSCRQLSSVWECRWDFHPTVSDREYTVSVIGATSDDMGNLMLQRSDKLVTVDRSAVPLQLLNFTILHGESDYGNMTVKDDTVEYQLSAPGASRVVASFASIGLGDADAVCDSDKCTVSATIARSGPYQANVVFTSYDSAGNTNTLTHQFYVFGTSNEQNPNHWSSTVSCSPSAIDRSITSLINQKVYCAVKLNGASDVSTAGISLEKNQCTGDTGNIADISLMNGQAGSKNPYIMITLTTGDYAVNNVNIKCPLSILSKVGTSFTQNPETELADMTLRFYNNPLGEMNKNLDEKIKQAKEDAQGAWEVVGVLRAIFGWGEKLCEIRMIIANTLASIDAVIAGFEALTNVPVYGETVRPTYMVLCQSTETLKNDVLGDDGILSFMGEFCNIMNCKAGTLMEGDDGLSAIGKALGGGTGIGLGAGQKAGPWANADVISDTYNAQGASGISRVNIKESLVWSVASFCVPGIIYNVDKMRQIQCRYAVCLADEVKNKGVNPAICDDEKNYMWCNFVANQAFSAIPWLGIFNYWMGIAQEIVAEPWRGISLIIGQLCSGYCSGAPGYSACAIPKTLAIIGQTIQDYQTIKGENFFSVGDGWCDEMEELDKEGTEDQGLTVTT